ncbi:Flp pilus assembly protein, peptidase CpaA [Cupriavidus necator]|uniref:Flp pilus assembly leader peptidase CpaA n=1 Tax=Cupriavidus necator (strain ATCC 17699 / DSM 428 / KCTC 22496 / NCIMB 10442 / H16 / Stanier 337) TaxID=381666 RepID=Q0KDQ3_CUPNH|nr:MULTISPECIES: prepilin peptidase [Cupriavidus]EON17899.1 flp pilus assembly leader peptidase CpaA [Cupriavidus sp. GA3-3]KUE89432.1 peptidase A24 [Cupriavidus necator]QCB99797.1 peptidase A24 [Cupriavidus necator H16]QQB77386.1 prepilin peptidase [Cupriavidus necator]WKA41639.1 prepilin peptidase [Cupriavidus necator]
MQAATALAPLVGPATIGIVLTAAAIDLDRRRIPNWLTFGAWIAALPLMATIHGPAAGSLAWLYGWTVGLVLFLPFYLMRGMAAGDVKLMAAVGAWLGGSMALKIALATCVIGGAWALVQVLATGQGRSTLARVGHMLIAALVPGSRPVQPQAEASAGSLPYGVAIAAGTLTMLFAGT